MRGEHSKLRAWKDKSQVKMDTSFRWDDGVGGFSLGGIFARDDGVGETSPRCIARRVAHSAFPIEVTTLKVTATSPHPSSQRKLGSILLLLLLLLVRARGHTQ